MGTYKSTVPFFGLPVSQSSMPAGTLSGFTNAWSECTDGQNRLFVVDKAGNRVKVFTQPIHSGASPAFSLSATTPSNCALDSAGDLYISEQSTSRIDVYRGPVTGAMSPTSHITNAVLSPCGVGLDSNGDVFVSNLTYLTEYSPLASGNTLIARFGSVVDNYAVDMGPDGNLYVMNGTAHGEIDVYRPPFSNTSKPDHGLVMPNASNAYYFAWDSVGNFYVGGNQNNVNSVIWVFAPPYTGAPTTTLLIQAGVIIDSTGVAIAP